FVALPTLRSYIPSYTTLFRSCAGGSGRAAAAASSARTSATSGSRAWPASSRGRGELLARAAAPATGCGGGLDDAREEPPRVRAGDRKSTRLNSSHVAITYAAH